MATEDIAKAIKEINPDAEFKYMGNDIDSIEWLGDTTPISKSAIQTKMSDLPSDTEATTQLKADAKSGNKKLLDLGLSQAEATALTGYKPPEDEYPKP